LIENGLKEVHFIKENRFKGIHIFNVLTTTKNVSGPHKGALRADCPGLV